MTTAKIPSEDRTVTPAVGTLLDEMVRPHWSHCRFPLPRSDSGLRHYSTHTEHQESECLRLLHAEIERLTGVVKKANDQAERMREALQHIAQHCSGEWPERCQTNVRTARNALAFDA